MSFSKLLFFGRFVFILLTFRSSAHIFRCTLCKLCFESIQLLEAPPTLAMVWCANSKLCFKCLQSNPIVPQLLLNCFLLKKTKIFFHSKSVVAYHTFKNVFMFLYECYFFFLCSEFVLMFGKKIGAFRSYLRLK